MRILLVEDQAEAAELARRNIERAGFTVDQVASIDEARAALTLAQYSIALLDRRLPDGDGLKLAAEITRSSPATAIIFLTALDQPADVIAGLDCGGIDYISKPYDTDELLARIRSALRRFSPREQMEVSCGNVRVNFVSREITVSGSPLVLRQRQLTILESLVRRVGRVVQRDALIDEVFGFNNAINSNTLDAHVSRLRVRLNQAGALVAIHPVRGVGYMIAALPELTDVYHGR